MNKSKCTVKYKKLNSNYPLNKEDIEYNKFVKQKENIYKNIWGLDF